MKKFSVSIKTSIFLGLFIGISFPILIAGNYMLYSDKEKAHVGFAKYRENMVQNIALAMSDPLDKFSPKFDQKKIDISTIESMNFVPNKEVHIKVNRRTEYGDRYKLFIIKKMSFEKDYAFEDYGVNLINEDGRITIDKLKWNGLAKKDGVETGDVIIDFKIENLDRPNKAIIYPFALTFLLFFGYLNYRRKV